MQIALKAFVATCMVLGTNKSTHKICYKQQIVLNYSEIKVTESGSDGECERSLHKSRLSG